MIRNDVISALEEKNHEALAACFAQDCQLIDLCPAQIQRTNTFLYGNNAIEMAFRYKFTFGMFTVSDIEEVDEQSFMCKIDYRGSSVLAIAKIEDFEGTLIKKLVITPTQ